MVLFWRATLGQFSRALKRDLIYDACAARRIHHIRVGGRRAIRLKPKWIDEWLERHTVVAEDEPSPVAPAAGAGARTEVRP